jgi:very-short-patch-repair endonuclease
MPTGVYIRTAEYRAALSAGMKGRQVSAETRAKIGAAHRGRKHTPEFCLAMSLARRGRPMLEHVRLGLIAANTGRPHSDETKAKISAAHKGRKQTPEAIAKMSAARRGVKRGPYSPEHCAAIGAANKGKRRTPEQNEANRSARIGFVPSMETRAKISNRLRREWESGVRSVVVSKQYTPLAQSLQRNLAAFGIEVEPEVRFGPYTVDLYDARGHVAYEADGEHWHRKTEQQRPGNRAKRDAYLSGQFGLTVIHFTGTEIRSMSIEEAG